MKYQKLQQIQKEQKEKTGKKGTQQRVPIPDDIYCALEAYQAAYKEATGRYISIPNCLMVAALHGLKGLYKEGVTLLVQSEETETK